MTELTAVQVQAARVDITPEEPIGLFGRAGRSGVSQSIGSPLEANCVLVENGGDQSAMVSIDSLYPSQDLIDAIVERVSDKGMNISSETLLIVASHSHNAPALDRTKPKLGLVDLSYLNLVADRIADCLHSMKGKHSKVSTIAVGQAHCGASIFRRRRIKGLNLARMQLSSRTVMSPNPLEGIDQTLKLILLADDLGQTKAVFWTWPCHAVSEPDAQSISADFPGIAREHIRKAFGIDDLPVLYFPGFSADIRPGSKSLLPLHKFGKWIGVGWRFARNSIAQQRRLQAALKCALDKSIENVGDPKGVGVCNGFTKERRILAVSEIRNCDSSKVAPLTCDEWSLGPFTIKAISAEVSSGYAERSGGSDPLTFLTGCAQQVFGYIPLDNQIPEGGYEVTGFAGPFSIDGSFHENIEEKVLAMMTNRQASNLKS